MPGSYRLRWSQQAVLDAQRLYDFIHMHNPDAARRSRVRIRESVRRLLIFPRIGRRALSLETKAEVRQLYIPVGQGGYCLRYKIEDKAITIIKIWHMREKPPV